MLRSGIGYKLRIWKRACLDSAAFVKSHKLVSAAVAAVSILAAYFLIFGETEGVAEIRPAVYMAAAGLGLLTLIFIWNLFWAPFQIEKERAAESEKTIAGIQSENEALRNENIEFKKRLNGQNNDSEAIDRLEKLFRGGEAILRENVGRFEMFIDWREQVWSWNELVLDALPKSERFGFETIAEWVELTVPVAKLETGAVVNAYMRNGKAYMHSKMIKLRKIMMGISGM